MPTDTATSILPFTVEIDTRNNGDVILQAIPGSRLRGGLSASKTVTDAKSGEDRIPVDRSRGLGMYPTVPGQRIEVDADKGEYTISDPLHDNKELCARIKRQMDANGVRTEGEVNGVPTKVGELDDHRMKCLCRELLWLVESGDAKIVDGVLPSIDDIDGLPGNYLLNPGSRVNNSQPTYEKDFDRWYEDLVKAGG